jgi:hypothetical protein
MRLVQETGMPPIRPHLRRAAALSVAVAALGLTASCDGMEPGLQLRPYTDSVSTYEQRQDRARSYAPGSLDESRRYIYDRAEEEE